MFLVKTRMPQRISLWGSFLRSLSSHQFYQIILSILLGIAYGRTIAPDLSWANEGADGGDLIAAAYVRGVAHPTGYPLYLVIARLFQSIPVGTLAFRTNLLSAACAIAACMIIFHLVRALLGVNENILALIAALNYGFSPLLWSQAVITEVYSLQALLVTLFLYLLLPPRRHRPFLSGLIIGLAVSNHLTALLLLPLLLFEHRVKVTGLSLSKSVLYNAAGFFVGASLYLLLPLWSRANPPVNWEYPVTWQAFINLVSAKIYHTYFLFLPVRVRGVIGLITEQEGVIGIVIIVYALLNPETWKKTCFLIWIVFSHVVFVILYATQDAFLYLIPAILAFSIWYSIGLRDLIAWLSNLAEMKRCPRSFIPKISLLIVAISLGIMLVRAFHTAAKVDASKDTRAILFLHTFEREVPQNALVFSRDDETTFALWYYQFALHQRCDVRILAEGLLPYEWYHNILNYIYPELVLKNGVSIGDIVLANPNLPYCFVWIDDLDRGAILCP